MSMRHGIGRSYPSQRRMRICVAATVFVTAAIALVLSVANIAAVGVEAYAKTYVVPQTVESDDDDKSSASSFERIDDESNPLAAGTSKSASTQEGFNFEILVLAGIIVFIVVFGAWIIRLNTSIRKMDDSMRSKKRPK